MARLPVAGAAGGVRMLMSAGTLGLIHLVVMIARTFFPMVMVVVMAADAAFPVVMVVVMAAGAAFFVVMVVVMAAGAAFPVLMVVVVAAGAAFFVVMVVVMAAGAAFLMAMGVVVTASAAFPVLMVVVMAAATTILVVMAVVMAAGAGFGLFHGDTPFRLARWGSLRLILPVADVFQALGQDGGHMVVVQGVVDQFSFPAVFHQMGRAQQPKLVRHRRLGQVQKVAELKNAALLLKQSRQDTDPGRVPEHFKDFCHPLGLFLVGRGGAERRCLLFRHVGISFLLPPGQRPGRGVMGQRAADS